MGLRLLALACLVGAAFAGPVQTGSRCATSCSKSQNPKFAYDVGKKYVYEYKGENHITVAGKQKQKATISGMAEIHVVDQCESILKLKNMRIQQKLSPQEIQDLKRALEVPLSFSWEDGQVEHVCPSSEDHTQSVNIKKGIISTLVNTMSQFESPQEVQETDSLGKCLTQYTVKSSHGLEVRKEKSLKSCTNRHSSITSLITNPYDSPNSQIHTLPVFPEETLVCKQQIENKIIKKVECLEKSKIQPMKSRDSVIQFEGTVQLSLLQKQTRDRLQMEAPQTRESLLYNLQETKDDSSRERETEDLLREMCTKNQGALDVTVSKDFIKLVSSVKTLSDQSLEKIHRSLKNGRICSNQKVLNIFLDTLPMAGSEESVQFMVHLLERNEVHGLKSKLWPASFALIPNPTKETVAAVVPLLKADQSGPVLLGVSALVNRFCSRHRCDSVPEVQEIIQLLNQELGHKCSVSKEEKVIAALKALGNTGYLRGAEENILACAKDSSKSARLRLAAIDAFRRSNEKRPEEMLQMYADKYENYEIRIAAFSSVLSRADMRQIREIKRVAEQETDEQVSGYVFTSLKNMNKTSSQPKKMVKQLLKNVTIDAPKVNYWQNSKNIELSAFSETLNIGGGMGADVIHAPESKIPRSIYSRFDVDVFDKNMNIFEFGVRAEGLEKMIKKLIGLRNAAPKSSPSSWDMFNSKSILGEDEVEASLFVRMMNTEIFDISASDLSAVKEMVQIAEFMNKLAAGREADVSYNFLFLNSRLVIPSVTGRSYSIDLTGSVNVGLTASSKLDLLSFPRSADVHLRFQPSANVEISTTVGIQSNQHRPDLKLVSRAHVESDQEAEFQIKDGHVAWVSVSTPSENIAFAQISTDILEIEADHTEKRLYEDMQTKVNYCFDKLHKPLGVSICGKLEVPKPFVTKRFPFIHPIGNAEFFIKKTDRSLKSYQLYFEIPKTTGHTMKYRASLDTPESHVSRRFAVELDIKQRSGQKEFSLELVSPFKTAGGSGSYTWNPQLYQGSLELHSSSSRLFSVNTTAHSTSTRARQEFKSSTEIIYRNQHPVHVEGTVSFVKGRKEQISFEFQANKPSSRPITAKGTIMKEGRFELSRQSDWKLSSDVAVQSPLVDFEIRSGLDKQSKRAQSLSSSLFIDYQRRGMEKHSIKLSSSAQQNLGKMSTNAHFESTEFPSADWSLRWDMQGELPKNLKNDITLKYGRNPEQNYFNIKQSSSWPHNELGNSKIALKAPQFNVNSELSVSHELKYGEVPKLYLETDLRYKADKHVRSLFEVNYASVHPLNGTTRIEFERPGQKISYWDSMQELSPNNYVGEANLQWQEDKKVQLKYKYIRQNEGSKLSHKLETSLQAPQLQSPIKSKASFYQSENAMGLEGVVAHSDSEYSLQANANEVGVIHLTLKSPKADGNLKFTSGDQKKYFDLDLKLKTRNPRRLTATGSTQLEERQRNFEVEILYDDVNSRSAQKENSYYLQAQFNQEGASNITLQLPKVNGRLNISCICCEHQKKAFDMDLKWKGRSERHVTAKAALEVSNKIKKFDMQAACDSTSQARRSRNPEFFMQVQLSNKGASHLSLKAPQMEGKLQVSNDNQKKALDFDLKMKTNSRHIIATANMDSEDKKKKVELELLLDADRHPEQKVALFTVLEFNRRSGENYASSSRLQITDLLDISLARSGAISLRGNKEVSLEASIKNFEPVSIAYKQEMAKGSAKSVIKYSKNHVQKAEIKMEGTYLEKNRERELSVKTSVKSLDNSFEDKEFSMSHQLRRSSKSNILKCAASYQKSPNAVYKAEFTSNSQPNGMQIQTSLKTPHSNFEKQALDISYQHSSDAVSSSMNIEIPNNKVVSVTAEIKKKDHGLSTTMAIQSPFDIVKDAKVHLDVDNHRSKKSLLSYVEVNGARMSDLQLSMTSSSRGKEVQGQWKISQIPNVDFQGLDFSYQQAKNSMSLSCKMDLTNNKQILAKSEIKQERDNILATASLETPFRSMKGAKMHFSIEKQSSKRNMLFYIDANEERKGDIEISMTSSSKGMDLQSRMKIVRVPEVSARVKVEKSGQLYSVSANVLQEASPSRSRRIPRHMLRDDEQSQLQKISSDQKSLFDFQFEKELSGDKLKKYSLKASGALSPVSLAIHSDHNEKSSLSMEMTACKEKQRKICYSLKVYQKSMQNSEGYRFYKKMTFDLEKSQDDSAATQIGSAQFQLALGHHDHSSKTLLQYKEKKIGYEVRFHHQQNENDQCALESQWFMLDRTARLKGSFVHNSNRVALEVEAIPDMASPSSKCSLELNADNSKEKEISGYLKMSHARRSTPIILTLKMEKEHNIPVRGKIELQYSQAFGKAWTLEVEHQPQHGTPQKREVTYKLYRQDKRVEASVKLMKQSLRDEQQYGYEWQYKSQRNEKKGGFSVSVSQRKAGRPQTINIRYFTPSSDLQIQANQQAPSVMNMAFLSRGRKIKEVIVRTKGSCIEVEAQHPGPDFKSSFCFNQQKGDTLELVKIEAHCDHKKCLNIRAALEPESPSFVDVDLQWERRHLLESLSELSGLRSLFNDRSLEEIEEELKEKLRHLKEDLIEPKLRELLEKAREIKERCYREIKERMRRHSEQLQVQLQEHMDVMKTMKESIVSHLNSLIPWEYIRHEIAEPVKNIVKCFVDNYVHMIVKHIPDLWKLVYETSKDQFETCLKKVCTPGTLCYEVLETLREEGYTEAKKLVQRKITKAKHSLQQKLPKVDIPDFGRYIREVVVFYRELLERIFGKFLGHNIVRQTLEYVKELEEIARQKAINFIERVIERFNEIIRKADRDEDFRTAKSMAMDVQKEMVHAWENREQMAEKSWVGLQKCVSQSAQKLMQSRLEVREFEPEEGRISFRVRNPFKPAHIQIMSNELRTIKRKIQQSVSL